MTEPESKAISCSICIANYNGIELIDACIDSVRSQACDFTYEIIVHDDAFTDGSADHIATKYRDVQLVVSQNNVGFCVANNRMATVARGDFLLLLNNDATLHSNALATLMHESLRLRQPAILTLPQFDAETGELLDIGSLFDPFLNPIPNRNPEHNDVGMAAGACLWIPRLLWLELGGFPAWFGSIGEDLYLCCRARLAGYPVRAIGMSGYRHHVGRTFGGGKTQAGRLVTTYNRRALSERNKTFVMTICFPSLLMWFLLPLHLLLLLIEGVVLSLLRREWRSLSDIYLPVPLACWRERGRLRNLRREVQAARRIGVRIFLASFRLLPHKLVMLFRHGLPRLT